MPGARAWTGRGPVAAAAVLCGVLCGSLAACAPSPPSSTVVTIPIAAGDLSAFGPTPHGPAVVVAFVGSAFVDRPGGTASLVPRPLRSGVDAPKASSASIDAHGTVWLVSGSRPTIVTLDGQDHPLADAVRALYAPIPVGGGDRLRVVDDWATTVVDDTRVYVPTSTAPTTFWHADNSVVYAVTTSGATPAVGLVRDAAGAPAGAVLSDLRPGQSAPATQTAIDLVQTVVPLGQDSFALFVDAPTEEGDSQRARLQGAVVSGGRVTRLRLPDLCASQYAVRGVRVDDHTLILSAPAGDGRECGRDRAWVKVDTASATYSVLGTGPGLAYLDGNTLVTATRTGTDQVTVAWVAPSAPTG